MGYLLEQLQAYQNRLKELELHNGNSTAHHANRRDQLSPCPHCTNGRVRGGQHYSTSTVARPLHRQSAGRALGSDTTMGELEEGQVVVPVNAPLNHMANAHRLEPLAAAGTYDGTTSDNMGRLAFILL